MTGREDQRAPRFTKRLEATFSSGDLRFRGISSDFSEGGLFIRTRNGLNPGNIIDMEIYLPNGKICKVKGIVRRTIKTPLSTLKNGMGIELLEKDQNYLEFIKTFHTEDSETQETEDVTAPSPAAVIVTCPECKVKNRVPKEKLLLGAKCGKCGAVLNIKDIS